MFIKRVSLILCLWSLLSVSAQETESYNFKEGLFEKAYWDRLNQSPSNFYLFKTNDFTRSSVYFILENGHLKQGNEPESITGLGLNTRGKYTSEKGNIFFGNFNIEKSYYQNLAWNLSYQLPQNGAMPDPHYFGVSKPAPWDNQSYALSGGMISPIFGENLKWLVKADYFLENKYRTDFDPRPKITRNELKFQTGFIYTVQNRHHLKVNGSYTFLNVENNIEFSNNNQNRPGNYDIYVRWIAGYGSLASVMQNNTKRNKNTLEVQAGYAFVGKRISLLGDFTYSRTEQVTLRNANIVEEDLLSNQFARYKPEKINLVLQSYYDLDPDKKLHLILSSELMDAENFWIEKGGKTYSSNYEDIGLNLNYIRSGEIQNELEIGTNLQFWNLAQYDALSGTRSQYSNLEAGIRAKKLIRFNNRFQISPYSDINIRLPMNSEFINQNAPYLEGITENDFAGQSLLNYYDNVIHPDFELFTSQILSYSLGSSILLYSAKNSIGFLNLKAKNSQPLKYLNYLSNNGASRWSALVSLNIYY